jgi:hypothetical protein
VLLAQVALQFSVNCVTGNTASQAAVWELYFPDHFQVRNPALSNIIVPTCLTNPFVTRKSLSSVRSTARCARSRPL